MCKGLEAGSRETQSPRKQNGGVEQRKETEGGGRRGVMKSQPEL